MIRRGSGGKVTIECDHPGCDAEVRFHRPDVLGAMREAEQRGWLVEPTDGNDWRHLCREHKEQR